LLSREKGDNEGAAWAVRRALEIRERHLGGDDKKVETSLHNLGVVLLDQGQLDEAESLPVGPYPSRENPGPPMRPLL
jgi:hypothetical protein